MSQQMQPPPVPQEQRDLDALMTDLCQAVGLNLGAIADWCEERDKFDAPGWRWLRQKRRAPWTWTTTEGYSAWSAILDGQHAINTPPHFLPLSVFQIATDEGSDVPAMASFDTAEEAWRWAARHVAVLVRMGRLTLQ